MHKRPWQLRAASRNPLERRHGGGGDFVFRLRLMAGNRLPESSTINGGEKRRQSEPLIFLSTSSIFVIIGLWFILHTGATGETSPVVRG